MYINDFCAPALLYVAFSLTHIIIDTFKRMYNTALVKIFIMIIFTFILNLLCQRGLGIISWFIVFIPFITMTVITTLLLLTFGLSPFSGKKTTIERDHHHDNKKKKCHQKKQHHDTYYN